MRFSPEFSQRPGSKTYLNMGSYKTGWEMPMKNKTLIIFAVMLALFFAFGCIAEQVPPVNTANELGNNSQANASERPTP